MWMSAMLLKNLNGQPLLKLPLGLSNMMVINRKSKCLWPSMSGYQQLSCEIDINKSIYSNACATLSQTQSRLNFC